MITAVTDKAELERLLGAQHDVYTEKIRSYAEAYGFGYDFCTFAAQDSTAVICSYYGDAVCAPVSVPDPEQSAELSSFLTFGQYRRVLMPYPLCEQLGLAENADTLYLMKCNGDVKNSVDCNKEKPVTDASLGQIYEIVSSGFDIDRDTWYTDTSHMLRHGIARAYVLGGAACAIQMFASGGVSYVSYVCTRPEMRGRGLARELLGYICAGNAENGSDTFVFCREELRDFYENAGFSLAGKAAETDKI
ncbi:MAG: GNAT family N-acetyltransferase [Ruminiclostridium sp.]|nr:GNAT family N-acetyltransferase [Ruminiclostridium sp.]